MIFHTNVDTEFYTEERCFIVEIMNNSELKNLSIAQARVKPGVTTQLHKLDIDECYYILKGEGRIEVGDELNNMVKPGDVIYIKSGMSQRITNLSDSDLIFLCICNPKFRPASYTSLE